MALGLFRGERKKWGDDRGTDNLLSGWVETGRMIKIYPIWRIIALLIFLIPLLPGCTNIREVETLAHDEQAIVQTGFINEQQAIKSVTSTSEVIVFRKSIVTPCIVQVEQYPSITSPVYIVKVAEDQDDHLVVYSHYTIDAYSGRIFNQE
jgi:hypothetical protein